jgi:hypothetical protein
MSRFHDSAGAFRPATLSLAGLALAAVAVVAVAATPGRQAAAAPSTAPSTPAAPATPASQAPDPTAIPTPIATPTPSAAPIPDPDGSTIEVDLETFDRHDVHVSVVDRTGSIRAARSGQPGDNPSADGLVVRNVDARTLRLTWVDFPIDNDLHLFVDEVDGHVRLLLIQPRPTEPTDAVGMDRQLVLAFDRPVDAATVETIIQDGMDTPG